MALKLGSLNKSICFEGMHTYMDRERGKLVLALVQDIKC